jgi:hypothetical protein
MPTGKAKRISRSGKIGRKKKKITGGKYRVRI